MGGETNGVAVERWIFKRNTRIPKEEKDDVCLI